MNFPGPNVLKELLGDTVKSNTRGPLTICIGNFVFPETIITSITPTFSEDVDKDNLPITIQLQLGFSTTKIATVELVDSIFNATKPESSFSIETVNKTGR